MSEPEFSLPGSGYDVITRILHAYALCEDGKVALDTVAAKSGINRTLVSRNSAFLVSAGVLSKGREKALNPQGKDLAIALGNGIVDDIRKGWRNVLMQCPATKSILDMVTVQKSILKDDIQGRMASALGLVASGPNKTGLNTLADLFIKAELLEVTDDAYRVHADTVSGEAKGAPADAPAVSVPVVQQPAAVTVDQKPPLPHKKPDVPSIHIDLEIHISPESSPEQIDKVFESISKHLYGRSDSK